MKIFKIANITILSVTTILASITNLPGAQANTKETSTNETANIGS